MEIKKIPFSKPSISALEEKYVLEALHSGHLSGDGPFSKKCQKWLETHLNCPKSLLTHSCTAALEMASLLINLKPGDEVIMPSFTFVSTANAVVLRGATPVFVDIRRDTLNINENLIAEAITAKTRAIYVVHYAGVACEMDPIMELAQQKKLWVVEDAAQGILSRYKDKFLGTIGHLGALSFHDTKNIVSGEGGALLINHRDFILRAEILREKGTNRSQFYRGEVDKYSWMDLGSSFLPSDLLAALLLAQLERSRELIAQRKKIWAQYADALKEFQHQGKIELGQIPSHCESNAHIFYLLLPNLQWRTRALETLKKKAIGATFHYVPLHQAPAGQKYARVSGQLKETENIADRILRLPLWSDLNDTDLIIETLTSFLKSM